MGEDQVVMPSSEYMDHALSLARLAKGNTSPNPAVGAVIVKDYFAIGMGYTQPAGSDHAEVMALHQAGEKARGATMYVTLEPCCYYGRTPPCTKAIIEAGISEVHISMLDPNPLVSGNGVKALNEAGIRTYVGSSREEAYKINEAYIKYITTGLPFVIAKFAMSLDGKIATRTGNSKWISSEESRKYVHTLRHCADAVMVGVNTVIADDPRLTARGCNGKGGETKKQPLRLIVDSRGRTPAKAQLFKQPGKTMLAVVEPLDKQKREQFTKTGVDILELPEMEGRVNLSALFKIMGQRNIVSVLVEGGSTLLGSLFDHHLVDRVLVFISPIIIGGNEAKTAIGGRGVDSVVEALHLGQVEINNFGDNILMSGYIGKKYVDI
jgi:diaminohydroxyphosphoribosylaminopyrimidine deaminase / 5-amino-6-(5-phosphoribosylamino)uracil reductase